MIRPALALSVTLSLLAPGCGPVSSTTTESTGTTDTSTGDDSTSGGTSTSGEPTTIDEPTTGEPTTTTMPGTNTGTGPSCGDGMVDAGEACDDGNRDESDACTNACAAAVCGDGLLQAGVEACDDGGTADGDGCSSACTVEAAGSCGDGMIGPGEECDDGNDVDTDECLNNCFIAHCGDEVVQDGIEECDDGNDDESDSCLGSCVSAVCGDGVIQEREEFCDDGNRDDFDGCTNDCELTSCEDGEKNAEETDTDCGGPVCSGCLEGQACAIDGDCASGECEANVCVSAGLTLPACAPAEVTAAQLFAMVVQPKCGCHTQNSPGGLNMASAAALQSNTVGVAAAMATMNRVTAGDAQQSYLLYKIVGQQDKAPNGGGSAMPLGGMLTDAERCLMINWVASGAQ